MCTLSPSHAGHLFFKTNLCAMIEQNSLHTVHDSREFTIYMRTPSYTWMCWGHRNIKRNGGASKLFLMGIIGPPPPHPWLGLTNVIKIGGDQSPRPHMFRWTWFAWGCQWMAIYLQHKTKRPRESVNWSKFYGWRHKHFPGKNEISNVLDWENILWVSYTFCTWRFQFEFLESIICFWFQTSLYKRRVVFWLVFKKNVF